MTNTKPWSKLDNIKGSNSAHLSGLGQAGEGTNIGWWICRQ